MVINPNVTLRDKGNGRMARTTKSVEGGTGNGEGASNTTNSAAGGFDANSGTIGNAANETGNAGNAGTATGSEPASGATIDNGGNTASEAGSNPEPASAGTFPGSAAPKRRGRPPKLDADGNRINAPKSGTTTTAQLGVKGFKPNDRTKAMQSIQSLHGMAAMLTKQPVFALQPEEAAAMSNALCDVCDYHQIDLFGGFGPYALYAQLAIVLYGVYMPRIAILGMKKAKPVNANPSPIETVGEAANPSIYPETGSMDFSSDVLQ